MLEKINERVDILASFGRGPGNTTRVLVHRLRWKNKTYPVETFGLHHPERRGSQVFHIFSFASGPTAFRVELNPETMVWTLMEAFYDAA